MTIEAINPDGLLPPHGYNHVHVASGSRTLYLAGQPGCDVDGKVVEGDYREQARRAMLNIATALEAAGAGPEHLVRLGIYVVRHRPEISDDVWEGLAAGSKAAGIKPVPTTLLGVHSLVYPELLVEIDAIAVLD